jgi:hypothetical protein
MLQESLCCRDAVLMLLMKCFFWVKIVHQCEYVIDKGTKNDKRNNDSLYQT